MSGCRFDRCHRLHLAATATVEAMDGPGNEPEFVVPARLRSLAAENPMGHLNLPELVRARSRVRELEEDRTTPLGPTARRRILQVARREVAVRDPGYVITRWLGKEEAIPGLLLSFRYEGRDVHGAQVRLRDLDIAFRRAAATLNDLSEQRTNTGWSYPMRPERGGLWLLDARQGSLEVVLTVYGALVAVATSQPIALAALASLALDAKVAASRLGHSIGRQFGPQPSGAPPAFGSPAHGVSWGIHNTKALEPVMLAAIEAGVGFEFVNTSSAGEIRIAIPPRDELERGD